MSATAAAGAARPGLVRRSLPAEAERATSPRAAAVEKAQGTVGWYIGVKRGWRDELRYALPSQKLVLTRHERDSAEKVAL